MANLDTDWIVPKPGDLERVISQLVLNAAERTVQTAGTRMTENLRMTVARIRGAVRGSGNAPLSATPSSIPPEAEQHCLILTARAMTASTPNLGSVLVGPTGAVYSPFDQLVKAAEKWMSDVAAGDYIPVTPTNPIQTGDGVELAPVGALYGNPPTVTVSGFSVGSLYVYEPGPNEAGLVVGATTLAAGGQFYATQTSGMLTGIAAGVPVTASIQLGVDDVNTTVGGDVVGKVDMSTD